jgi:hypothetical protein
MILHLLTQLQFLVKHWIPALQQIPYSLDLCPPEFFVFCKLRISLKGRFQTVEDIILIWRMDWRWYHKHPLNSASKSGKGSGRAALLHKGTILNRIIFNKFLSRERYYSAFHGWGNGLLRGHRVRRFSATTKPFAASDSAVARWFPDVNFPCLHTFIRIL